MAIKLREPDLNDMYQRPYMAPRPATAPIAKDAAPRKKGATVLPSVQPNVGIEAAYRRRMYALIEAMHNSIIYWIKAAYKKNAPAIAQDTAADELRIAMRKLARQWRKNFDEAAPELADYFATEASERSDGSLRSILRRAGMSVRFKMTAAARDIMDATINAQVGLIRSISQEYLTAVEGIVMRSVQTGGDLGQLSQDLQAQFGVTKRRAALIARHQNNMATSAMTRARQQELGLNTARWRHSHAGKEPRPTHVAMDGKTYDVRKGMWDPAEGRRVWPGELINCRCTSQTVVPGFG
jgi:SPP1 gp7 family putative phage head morphogenesis protein